MTSSPLPLIDHRHPWPVRLWHWVNVAAVSVLLFTGLLLFDIHPHLYWGDDGHEGMPAFVSFSGTHLDRAVPDTDLQIGNRHWNLTGRLGKVIDDGFGGHYLLLFAPPADWEFGATRGWHFAFAWILALSLALYAGWLVLSRRLQRRFMPVRSDLTFRTIGRELWHHLRLRPARGAAAREYNVLQKLTYLLVVFVLIPAMVLSGLTLSNTVTAAFPDLFLLFGGRQSARSVHFIAAMLLVLFVLVHVFQVFVAGFGNLTRSMLTGRYRIEPGESS